jgi:hypothetical protein
MSKCRCGRYVNTEHRQCETCRERQRGYYRKQREKRRAYMRRYHDEGSPGRKVCPACSQVIQRRLQRKALVGVP